MDSSGNSVGGRKSKYHNKKSKSIKKKDLGRTYPGHKFFQEEKTKEKMHNILRAFSNYNTEICYYQGMNFIRKK